LLEANDPSRYFATIATPQEWLNAMSELGLGFVLDETAHGSINSGNNTNSSRFIEASGGGNSDDDDDNNNNNDDEDDGLIDVDFGDNSADLQQLIASSNDGDINLPAITTTSISH
jgi:hypothetical protein